MRVKTMTAALMILLTSHAALPAADFPKPQSLPSRSERADVLTMLDGTKVATKDEWLKKRKPELRELFQEYMYGHWPDAPKTIRSKMLYEDKSAFGGSATLQEIEIGFDANGPKFPMAMHLLLLKPNGSQGPVPCFVGLSFVGNHSLMKDPNIRLPEAWIKEKPTDANRGTVLDVWPFEAIVKRGYAIAVFYCGDIQPDRPNVNEGLRRAKLPGDPGTIISWAWGASRAVDYLMTDPAIDAKKIAVVGHSRLGKAAIVAAAFDERFAMAIPHQAGCGGTGPSRHDDPKAESVKRITATFPQWFSGNFPYFGEHLDKLPFDQHCLVALCAPRPVLCTNAVEDLWANPHGQFEMLKAATPVYQLLGVEGLTAKEFPKVGELIDSRLGYHIRDGKHSMKPEDWQVYMHYADKWLK